VLEQVLHVLHHAGRDSCCLQLRDEHVILLLAGPLCDRPAPGERREPRLLRGSEEADGNPAVVAVRRIYVLAEHRGICIAHASRCRAALRRRDCGVHLLHADLVHGRVDVASAPAHAALHQRRRNAGSHHVGHDHVAIWHGAGHHRIAIRPAGEKRAAGQRAARAIHAPLGRQRAGLPEDTARGHDQPRMTRRELRESEPQLVHGSRREILDHGIGPAKQRLQYLA
jgi:hypothetical protein